MNQPNKIMRILGICLGIATLMVSCKSEKEDNSKLIMMNLLYSNLANQAKAVIYMERIDRFTFNGYCLDNFAPGMTADTYYTMHPISSSLGTIQKATLVVTKTSGVYSKCSNLGFATTFVPQTINEGGVKFDKYACGPQEQGSACPAALVTAAGFTSGLDGFQ